MFKKIFNFKASILAFEISFIFLFFIGIFWNPPIITERFDQRHQLYVNRGYPKAWAGISAIDKDVEFPIIRAPLITSREPFEGKEFNKIIDLTIFLPLFITTFLIVYIFTFFFGKASDENKSLNIILIPIYLIMFLACIFVYFFWFPRL